MPEARSCHPLGTAPGVELVTGPDRPASLRLAASTARTEPAIPLVALVVDGEGTAWAGTRNVATTVGDRLRVREVTTVHNGVVLEQVDDLTGLAVTTRLTCDPSAAALRITSSIRNDGTTAVTLRGLTVVVSELGLSDEDLERVDLVRGRNDWLAENRWRREPVRAAGLVDIYRGVDPAVPRRRRGALRATSTSSWSTVEDLPTAALVHSGSGLSTMWQIEHNGPWTWQVGEHARTLYLALSGPTDADHQWAHELLPAATFESVPVTIAWSQQGLHGVVAAMTDARRATRTVRDPQVPVVFNDYMNTLMGDPSDERLAPLIDAAHDIGVDIFVIDAGWYADDGDWWETVGEWQPSTGRFPDGFTAILDQIRSRGLVPGLWLEPEVVGVRSPIADKLPPEAFLSRDGHRWSEDGRFHLDLAHPAARGHLNEVVDRLVDDLGVGYLKLDYNVRAGAGTDWGTASAGDGLLRHNRAYLAWLDDVRARHPLLLLENCASGGMRQDYAQLSRHDLQSTSDQESAELYPPIAAAAPMSMEPQLAANWAYPQPTMTDEQIVFTLVTGLTGRLYLSGFLDGMNQRQRALVRNAVTFHQLRLGHLINGLPVWPLGLPDWDDRWVAVGLYDAATTSCLINVWQRRGAEPSTTLRMPAAPPGYRWTVAEQVFPAEPTGASWTFRLDADTGRLEVGCAYSDASARVVMVTATPFG